MAAYIISYDLNKPEKDYPRLIDELRRLGALKILYSEWLLRNNATALQIRDHLVSFIDQNDGLFVAELAGAAAWRTLRVPDGDVKTLIEGTG